VVVNSRALEEAAVELGAPPERIRSVLWHADLEGFSPERRRRDDDAFVVLSLRNFRPDTHIDVLVRAFARVRQEETGARLVLAARRGPLRADVERLVEELGLVDAVDFVSVPASELPELIASADVAVTLTDSDSSPPSLLESMASGLPIVATPAASIQEWVRQDDGAELVPHGDVAAVAGALLQLARDPERRARHGERNRAIVRQRYGDPTGELEKIYRALIDA
jgi:glycosyltransferase involved in cell wall biosynthesis